MTAKYGIDVLSSRRRNHGFRARLEGGESLLERDPGALNRGVVSVRVDLQRLANRNRHRRERLRDLRAVPAVQRPEPIRLYVERNDGIAGRFREPHGAGLRYFRRAARSVE